MSSEEKRVGDSAVNERISRLEELLLEIRDSLTRHIAEGAAIKPALEELVTLWRGSKMMGLILSSFAAVLASLLAVIEWWKAHWK